MKQPPKSKNRILLFLIYIKYKYLTKIQIHFYKNNVYYISPYNVFILHIYNYLIRLGYIDCRKIII